MDTLSCHSSVSPPSIKRARLKITSSSPNTVNPATHTPAQNDVGAYQTRTCDCPDGTAKPIKAALTRIGFTRSPLTVTFQPGHQGMLLTMRDHRGALAAMRKLVGEAIVIFAVASGELAG